AAEVMTCRRGRPATRSQTAGLLLSASPGRVMAPAGRSSARGNAACAPACGRRLASTSSATGKDRARMFRMDGMSVTETLPFQAETKQLLDIVIHSLYSNKEIFLRELLSNASDALDKLKLEALERHSLLDEDPLLEIELVPDSKARTLTVSDSGIGMTRDEVVRLIGTIAKSGTRELVEQLKAGPPT